jgi:S1-C subfamily serine protease
MAATKELLFALDMLTEGTVAEIAPEALRAEAPVARREHKSWTTAPGIQGFGIGEKITSGKRLKEVVLKIYVEKKLPESQLADSVVVPEEIKIGSLSKPVPTDVQAIGKVTLEENTTRQRPLIPGYSVGHPDITAGTLGCLVRRKGDKRTLYILSNSHVLANEGLAQKGDKILQPGVVDGGAVPADLIGKLEDFVPFQFTATGFPNLVDAAIANLKATIESTSAIRLIGVPAGVSTTLRRNMQVQKTGRTTDYTVGVITDINYRLPLSYKKPGGGSGRVGLRDQVLCTRYTAGGDSGSAVLNMKKEVVGLHFAGSPSSSIFNKIANVLAALNIEIVTQNI